MAESATLKVGNRPTWTKSTTAPFRNPGVRNSAVDQVAERTAEHQRQPDHHERVTGPAHRPHQQHGHHDGEDRQQRRERLEQAERTAGVAGEHEPDVVADQDRAARRPARRRPSHFDELVEHDDAEDDRGREHAVERRVRAGREVSLAASLGTSLAVDAGLGVRQGLEALEVDAPTGGEAQAVGAVLHALERAVDLVDDLLRRRREQEVALALDVDGVALARLLVELRVAALALGGELLGLGLELVGLLDVAGPLLEQARLQPLDASWARARASRASPRSPRAGRSRWWACGPASWPARPSRAARLLGRRRLLHRRRLLRRTRPSWPARPSSAVPSWPVRPSSWPGAFFAGTAFLPPRAFFAGRLLGRCDAPSPWAPSWPATAFFATTGFLAATVGFVVVLRCSGSGHDFP